MARPQLTNETPPITVPPSQPKSDPSKWWSYFCIFEAYGTTGGRRSAYKGLMGRYDVIKSLGRSTSRWKIIIK
jgi:hypothetical protein